MRLDLALVVLHPPLFKRFHPTDKFSYTSIYIVQSFHFAPRRQGESFDESVYRSEHYLALRTGMDGSKKVLDVGCGVGGPMRNIAAFTGADITGVTINEYQVRVANKYNEQKGLDKSCR